MLLHTIHLLNFKNHASLQLSFTKKVTCFIGENGIGKTNILDAIQYLTYFKNMYSLVDNNLIKNGETFFRLDAVFNQNKSIIIKYTAKSKSIEIEDIKVKKSSLKYGHIPVVISTPNDLFFLYGGSEERRKFIDITLSIINKEYLQKLLIYNKYLEQRNSYLKNEMDVTNDLLDIYDQKLIEYGEYIYHERKMFLSQFSSYILNWYNKISNQKEHISIVYDSQLHQEKFSDLLLLNRAKDKLLKRTTQGIHKDDILCIMNDLDLKKIGSQGQQKTFLFSLKIAQAAFLASQTNEGIIFLLDDFSDKLDAVRQKSLQECINQIDFVTQWFITDTQTAPFEWIENKEVIELK